MDWHRALDSNKAIIVAHMRFDLEELGDVSGIYAGMGLQ